MTQPSHITLTGWLHADTADAVFFGFGPTPAGAVWLPRSALTIELHSSIQRPVRVSLTLPRALADRKNLSDTAPNAAQPALL